MNVESGNEFGEAGILLMKFDYAVESSRFVIPLAAASPEFWTNNVIKVTDIRAAGHGCCPLIRNVWRLEDPFIPNDYWNCSNRK